MKIKVGDIVKMPWSLVDNDTFTCGVVVGFNKKGEGGKDFVHVLVNDEIVVCMSFDLHVIPPETEADV